MDKEKFPYLDVKKLPQYNVLRKHGLNMLTETIESFFGCNVQVYLFSERDFKEKFDINIHDNERRVFIL